MSISSSVNKTISGISTEVFDDLDELFDLLVEVDDFSTLLEEAFASLLDEFEAVLPEHAARAATDKSATPAVRIFSFVFSYNVWLNLF